MNGHLSPEDLTAWTIGERAPERALHLSQCAKCAAEVARLEQPLALFRGAVREWSGELLAAPRTAAAVPQRRLTALTMRLAAAAAVVVALVAIPVYEQQKRTTRQATELAKQDDLLLRQVSADISRSVPATMEPLTELMSWSPSSAAGTAENGKKESK